ncbi:C1 family peptidase [Pseudoduganella violaceinigra]|uniref:C1 family peptidase n=1 Tax=Pseudoduganella violaceinigra TaxID=246602 RepID=UPI0004162BB0|nr:C1 family peptidase [Pseudoduganella violaceinigra]
MPVETYSNLPPVGGAIPFDGGFPSFDLSDQSFLARGSYPIQLPTPGDQGAQGSCTAWAVGYAGATQCMRASGKSLPAAISPADLFAKIRNRLSPDACAQGSQIHYAMDVLVQEGATTLDLAPYSDRQCGIATAARTFNLDGYSRVNAADTVSIRGSVQAGQPVSFGILVNQTFQSLNTGNIIWAPNGTGGGHALSIIGYDDSRQLYKVINSWGTAWGQKGYFYISYADFARYAIDVCIPFLRRGSQNALLSSSKSMPNSPIVVEHMNARPYGGGTPGSYGVGVEMAWSQPLSVNAAAISVMGDAQNVLFNRNFGVSQIARGLRFGGAVPDGAATYRLVRASISGRDAAGALQTLTATTRPSMR